MGNTTGLARRAGFAATLVVLWLAWPLLATAQHDHTDHSVHTDHAEHADPAEHSDHSDHAEHASHEEHAPSAYEAPPITEADRAAAFPDLAAMHVGHAMLEDPLNKLVLLDRLETQSTDDGTLQRWDLESWVGKSLTKVWIRTEGERLSGATQRAELELLWGKSFARWWELVAGARSDFEPGPTQNWAAVGVRGTAPYRIDLEATAYFGDGGRAALRVKSHYELLVTNKLILQPLAELNWYAQRDAVRGIGAGLADAEIGLRLRYEVKREIAPYVGLTAERKLGGTADLARASGHDAGDVRFVAGIRLRF
jgi:copper resistance protein B